MFTQAVRRGALLLLLATFLPAAHAALADETQAFFVATTGSDLAAGTMAAPFQTIAKGISSAAASGTKKRVLVSQGTYSEAAVVPDGVSLYGGYDAASGWTRDEANTTTISATSNVAQVYTVQVSGCTTTCYIDGFTIVANNAGSGRNAVAVFLLNSPGARIMHNAITAANGGFGATGSAGSAGAPGGNGQTGQNGCNGCQSGSTGAGGAGGISGCSATGGAGGAGGFSSGSGQNGSLGLGGGSTGSIGLGAASDACFGGGNNGTSGGSGGDGPHGIPGTLGSSGTLSAAGWVSGSGSNGTAAGSGRGGSGGGGGGGGQTGGGFCTADEGGGGGGGGAGGCGGTPGAGGTGGGASIAVLAFGSAGAIVVANTITRGAGGSGGAGGAGGASGQRGFGQVGGGGADDAGGGGRGGDGGFGGAGGGGGGGAGGPSIGILAGSGTVSESNNIFSGGASGAGGAGGNGGATLGGGGAPAANSGATGAPGTSTNTSNTTSGGAATLTVATSGTGSIAADIGWIDCGATCSAVYATGTSVTLAATPGAGQVLAGWSGDCTGTSLTCVVPMSAARSATATFVAAGAVTPSAATLDFGGQSMATTSPPQSLTLTNSGGATISIGDVTSSDPAFAVTDNCATLTAGATCTVTVTFTPPANPATPLNGTVNHAGTLTITSDAPGSPHTVTLAGVGEKSLVTHYYRSILRRTPENGAVPYWQGEAARVAGLGANVNETWFALAQAFFSSAEYVAFNRDATGFVTDLYATFFNRAPDTAGRDYWVSQMGQGMPREVVLVSFMFSPEFTAFTQGIFGNTAARAEVDTVIDFYRGLLSRLPDSAGFEFWVGQFRQAQCQGAGAVYARVEAISNGYVNSAEYAARGRTNAQFVGDMYNAFMRRGGDLAGVQFWIGQLDGGRTRESVRQAFMTTPEFDARVQAIIAQGCLQ